MNITKEQRQRLEDDFRSKFPEAQPSHLTSFRLGVTNALLLVIEEELKQS